MAELGGTVIGTYGGYNTAVECLCPEGHPCNPLPAGLTQGEGMCRKCAHAKRARAQALVAERAFRERIAMRGGQVVGEYVNDSTPVACVCPNGHRCRPRPGSIQRGQGMCAPCAGKDWDSFYVVASPTARRVKFGITTGDPRPRLADHRRASYSETVRVITDLPDAALLERNILSALRAAGMTSVKGREYFDQAALPLVLDVVDGWAQMAPTPTKEAS